MGHYANGGENEIGVALTESWAAVWIVDTPYIDVLLRGFYDENADAIKAAAENGEMFSDEKGQTGSVAVIGTSGYLNDDGFPKHFDDVSEYVADELSAWVRREGGAYERAISHGYGR